VRALLRGGTPPHRLTIGACPEKPIDLTPSALSAVVQLTKTHFGEVTPFVGPVLMRVGGRSHAAAAG